MPETKLSDLLPISSGVKKPNAYDVFGLEVGVSDEAAISRAMNQTIKTLKAAKPDADPAVWKTAANLLRQAQGILTDPERKAELDARYGIVQIPPATAGSGHASDPLAGLLPEGDPLAAAPDASAIPVPEPTASSGAPVQVPSDLSNLNDLAGRGVPAPPTSPAKAPGIAIAVPGKSGSKGSRPYRRKRSMFGNGVMLLFTLTLLAGVGVLGYFVFVTSGNVTITQGDGTFSIQTGTKPERKQPAPQEEKVERVEFKFDVAEPVDQVMKSPTKKRRKKDRSSRSLGEALNDNFGTAPMDNPVLELDDPAKGPGMEQVAPVNPEEMMLAGGDTEFFSTPEGMTPSGPDTKTTQPMTPASPEQAKAGADAIADVVAQIKSAKWATMKSAAELAEKLAASPEQKQTAETLYQIADLADYYRVGLVTAVDGLQVGNEVADTSGLSLLVVETQDDLLVVRRGAKSYRYTFDKIPIKLAHALAAFRVSPGTPTAKASAAVYQAIVPGLHQGYRDDAITQLQEIEGEVEGADQAKIAELLKKLIQ